MDRFLALVKRVHEACQESELHPVDQMLALQVVKGYVEAGPFPEGSCQEWRQGKLRLTTTARKDLNTVAPA